MKKKKIFVAGSIILTIIILMSFFILRDDISNNGKIFSSKQELCRFFAQSYLRTVQNKELNLNDEKQKMAIDIETDFYNICLLDLNQSSLQKYKSIIIEKYQK